MDKPHLLLDWHLDCTTGKLTCELLDGDLVYEAHSGGVEGYTKTYKGKVTKLINKSPDWQQEKYWISENWGDRYGYYQPDVDRVGLEESTGRMEGRGEGLGLDGEYIDHLQRSQHLLNGLDMAMINVFDPTVVESYSPGEAADGFMIKPTLPTFRTPDRGLTIYKLLPTTKTFYYSSAQEIFDYENPEMDNELNYHWQGTCPCQMLPYIKSYILSDYDEMLLGGVSADAIATCKAGEWEAPLKPLLQKHFTYPTENTHPLTAENITNLDNG